MKNNPYKSPNFEWKRDNTPTKNTLKEWLESSAIVISVFLFYMACLYVIKVCFGAEC